jgi:hypothetical protein
MADELERALGLSAGYCSSAAAGGERCEPSPMGGLRKGALYSFVVFLSISALLAIGCVCGGKFGELEVKVLLTTLTITLASICALCCGAYAKHGRSAVPSACGIALAGMTAALVIVGVWMEIEQEGYWKAAAVLGVFTVASAHALALLGVRLAPGHGWLKVGAAAAIGLLAAVLSGMIMESVSDDHWELVAVLAIIGALATLVIPIMSKAAGGRAPAAAAGALVLRPRGDGLYSDEAGAVFEVKRVTAGEPAAE